MGHAKRWTKTRLDASAGATSTVGQEPSWYISVLLRPSQCEIDQASSQASVLLAGHEEPYESGVVASVGTPGLGRMSFVRRSPVHS